MKTFFQSVLVCSFLFFDTKNVVFAESEPNNTFQTADTLIMNASDSGTLNSDTDEVDWWTIVLTADGKLIVNTTADGDLDVDLFLYDSDGTSQIAKFDTSLGIHEATHFDNLAAGTYYIKALGYSGSGNYTVQSIFSAIALDADPTQNSIVGAATTLLPNDTSTGHLGYFGAGETDEEDWWKITLPNDGGLIVNTLSSTSLDLDMRLYDIDGKTRIASFDTSLGVREAVHFNNLSAGTYFVKAYLYKGFGSYSISSIYKAQTGANDGEPNDAAETALNLGLNVPSAGRLGYYKTGATDREDWWKVNTTADAKLTIKTISDNSLDVDLYLYDSDGKTELAAFDSIGGTKESTHFNNLLPGTYFVKARSISGTYGAYSIIATQELAPFTNDLEPNDAMGSALGTPLFDTLTGHIGYTGNGKEDEEDWWYFVIPQTDTVTIRVETTATTDVLDMRLFKAPNLEESYLRSNRPDSYEEIRDELPKGTYYLDIYKYAKGYGSYKLSITPKSFLSNVSPLSINDVKIYPNPVSSTAMIEFTNPFTQGFNITLVNALGQTVKTIHSGVLPVGLQLFYVDVNDLPKGYYWCRIQNGNSMMMQALIIAP